MISNFQLAKSPAFAALANSLSSGESILTENLWSSSKALLAVFAAHLTQKSVLLITEGVQEDALFQSIQTLHLSPPLEIPSWETLPGEAIRPSSDLMGKRLESLYKITHLQQPTIALCSLQSLLQKVLPKESLSALSSIWEKGASFSFHELPDYLTKLGYKREPVVSDKGEFAIRGGLLDLYPISSPDPVRIEFWGDTIEEIRTFDPVGQKTIGEIDQFLLTPADEPTLLQKAKRLVTLLDFFPEEPLIFWDDLLSLEESAVSLQKLPGAASPFFLKTEDLFKRLSDCQQIFCSPQPIEELSHVRKTREKSRHLQGISFEIFQKTFNVQRWAHPFNTPLQILSHFEETDATLLELISPKLTIPTQFVCSNETEEKEILQELQKRGIDTKSDLFSFSKGTLPSGFSISDLPLLILPHTELTGRTHLRRQKWRGTTHTPAAEFHHLSPGDPVVHYHSGIGKFLGMEKQTNHLGVETEFMVIAYAENSKLFVPLSQAYLVSRYIGAHEDPPSLSQLGSKRWQNTRTSAQQQILGYANELLQLYAERTLDEGQGYLPDGDLFKQFEQDFPYSETSDQLAAIAAIKQDLQMPKPMDRLICGDVGYGKTEVAMRAAFKTVADGGKQVAVLVPTTVLAMQHFETFSQRMGGQPIRIGALSRFFKPKQNRETIQKASLGEIDILIGTHRLLSKDVSFHNLGLLIIDEEQRFGVKAKEHLKQLKAGINCLTLSATPIPRTLYMSLVHARDMSVIGTPPQDRLPVKSILAETDMDLIQNALLREFSRGGQAFFIHNRVETIFQRAETIQKLVPTARVGVVHGQMDSEAIDSIFHQFKLGAVDLLFATTLIENGIDIPNANTILIDRADTYGLADLYQLRGRVGRWNRSAYAYFLVPKNRRLPEPSRKRLNALVEASGYGGGMKIAMRDLEIRGAGDILGIQQSGQVSAIGFHLYCKMLKKAIDALKKKAPISFNEVKLEFSFDARIPESYMNEVSLRMEFYYRFGDATTASEIDELLKEMNDRFGQPPETALWLAHLAKLRVFASANQFTLLKFQNLTLLAEQQRGKKNEQQTILLPKTAQASPQRLEHYVIEQLQKRFSCKQTVI